jgi:CubicO group peptidase (beta-lactamase class C family)
LDDVVVVSNKETLVNNVTWWNVFRNTAGSDGRNAGSNFTYCSDLWKHASAAVERATGLPFLVAVQHYVLDAVGAVGSYNQNTHYPPYEARGYEGPLEDMLVLGSTLANRGVSPATGKRVLSAASVDTMLRDAIIGNAPAKQSFMGDWTAITMMNRFRFDDPHTNATRVPVRGYATGLWYTPGFRVDENGRPIRGWISMGEHNALYFDMTGVVVSYHASQKVRPPDIGDTGERKVLLSELSQPFSRVVSDLGQNLLDRMWDG